MAKLKYGDKVWVFRYNMTIRYALLYPYNYSIYGKYMLVSPWNMVKFEAICSPLMKAIYD
jgi:hypothetical protein